MQSDRSDIASLEMRSIVALKPWRAYLLYLLCAEQDKRFGRKRFSMYEKDFLALVGTVGNATPGTEKGFLEWAEWITQCTEYNLSLVQTRTSAKIFYEFFIQKQVIDYAAFDRRNTLPKTQ